MPLQQFATGSTRLPSSFRDPAAFVFRRDGTLYRQLNREYLPHYRMLMDSGLAAKLQQDGALVRHEEVDLAFAADLSKAGLLLKPSELPFISFPWEWTFSGLKDAALLTLRIMDAALEHGMILKDASARNIQFVGTTPMLIDTASFEVHDNGPWIAYRQFCENFLAPLALMAYGSRALGELQRSFIDGIPLAEAVRILPLRARLSPRLLIHCFGHARFVARKKIAGSPPKKYCMNVRCLVDSLRLTIEGLHLPRQGSEWFGYDPQVLYGESVHRKEKAVLSAVSTLTPRLVWDIGSNDGYFSLLAAKAGTNIIALESDSDASERCFTRAKEAGASVLPLAFDFNNPTAGGGVLCEEIQSIFHRGRPDMIILLGLIHHLCVTQNIPLASIAAFCRKTGAGHVLVEWIEPADDRAAPLLSVKLDHHPYDRATFDAAFANFVLVHEEVVSPTRSVLLFKV